MSQKLFLMVVSLITVIVLLILNAFIETAQEFRVVLCASVVALAHVLCGFYMTRWAFTKSNKLFMSVVMGGMGIRMMLVGIILVIVYKLVAIDIKLFIVTFGVYYLLFQIVEIYFVNRGLQMKKLNNNTI
ncbi:hypothetical protein L6Q79_12065 [bacterium]|nr:hypothetical protein [bacterium]NUN45838.1 hypothetical protein [bacterium]HMV27059.1 hypothetical protein [bacterium]HMW33689.1 hypothetical protein [bacterium]HMW36130.1 hypothetical protein [bacterium]